MSKNHIKNLLNNETSFGHFRLELNELGIVESFTSNGIETLEEVQYMVSELIKMGYVTPNKNYTEIVLSFDNIGDGTDDLYLDTFHYVGDDMNDDDVDSVILVTEEFLNKLIK